VYDKLDRMRIGVWLSEGTSVLGAIEVSFKHVMALG
jgi:hypothetical protein